MGNPETEMEMTIRHVRRGGDIVQRQRLIVAELEARGEDTGIARQLLTEFEDIQRSHMAHLSRLRQTRRLA